MSTEKERLLKKLLTNTALKGKKAILITGGSKGSHIGVPANTKDNAERKRVLLSLKRELLQTSLKTFTNGLGGDIKIHESHSISGAGVIGIKSSAGTLFISTLTNSQVMQLTSVTSNTAPTKKSQTSSSSRPNYGLLDALIANTSIDKSKIISLCPLEQNKLPTPKESSDIKVVTEFNTAINDKIKDNPKLTATGIKVIIGNESFSNIVGCIPIRILNSANKEPKADAVLVQLKNKTLTPICYFSYKKGKDATKFQNYSGLTEASSDKIFNHKATVKFYKKIWDKQQEKVTVFDSKAPYMKFPSDWKTDTELQDVIGSAIWGMSWNSGQEGIDNCSYVLQGDISIDSTNRLQCTKILKNGNFNEIKEGYEPVYLARFTRNRNNIGPKISAQTKETYNIKNLRLGIFPVAYLKSRTHILLT